MSLTRLLIRDFRNIETADLALSPGFNFLVGANGSGKTSVLEAIYTLGHGRAFRSLQIGRVIRHEQEAFVLHGRLQGEERETAIGLTKDKQGDSKVRIDGTDGHKVAELAHLMPMQLITPAAPNTEEHSSTGDAFTTNPDFSPPGAISSDCSSSAMRRCAR